MAPPIIAFDYDFSPYAQKIRLLLTALHIPFSRLDQPMILPRPDLRALGITYRRIPLLAIGKDVYADSSRIIETVTTHAAALGGNPSALITGPFDKTFEVWGIATFREIVQGLLDPANLSKDFIKDRETIFPSIKRTDAATLRPSGLASLRARMLELENGFLGNSAGPFINGEKISLADVHVVWSIRWALQDLQVNKEPGFEASDFPKVWRLIKALPKPQLKQLEVVEVHQTIRGSPYFAQELAVVQQGDLLALKAGTEVKIEDYDSAPGSHPQVGKLLGTDTNETVVEVGNDGIRLHYPKIGYIVRPAERSNL